MQVTGRHVIITGSGRGIGWALAKAFAAEAAHLYLVQRKFSAERVQELKDLGARTVDLITCDLTNPERVDELCDQLAKGTYDILVNNAGVLTGDLFDRQTPREIQEVFQVNVIALAQITRAVLPGMLARQSGKIVNNASVSAVMRFPCASTYAASKAAVLAFSECLEVELAGTGVGVLTLLTPGVKTEMFDQIEKSYGRHFETPKLSMSADAYADDVLDHIRKDARILSPSGATGIGLMISRYAPRVFRALAVRGFRR